MVVIRLGKHKWRGLRLVPSFLVPRRMRRDGWYKPGGFACLECNWRSKKRGFPGRQALRAHIKKHVNDRRSWQHPLMRQILLLTLIAVITLCGVFWLDLPLLTMVTAEASWWAWLTPITTSLITLTQSIDPKTRPTPNRLRTINFGRWACTLSCIVAGAGIAGLIGTSGLWSLFILFTVSGVVSLWLAPAGGLMKRALKQRRRQPKTYVEVDEAKDYESEQQLNTILKGRIKRPRRPVPESKKLRSTRNRSSRRTPR